jgi:hypothetical protein
MLYHVLYPQHDRITLEVAMNSSEYDGFVFALATSDAMNTLRNNRYDVSQFARSLSHPSIPAHLQVMTETGEIIDTMLNEDVLGVLKDSPCFEELVVSDQPVKKPEALDDTPYHKTVSATFRLPKFHEMDKMVECVELLLYVVDMLPVVAHFRPDVTLCGYCNT